jgi:hypothetical protein
MKEKRKGGRGSRKELEEEEYTYSQETHLDK